MSSQAQINCCIGASQIGHCVTNFTISRLDVKLTTHTLTLMVDVEDPTLYFDVEYVSYRHHLSQIQKSCTQCWEWKRTHHDIRRETALVINTKLGEIQHCGNRSKTRRLFVLDKHLKLPLI